MPPLRKPFALRDAALLEEVMLAQGRTFRELADLAGCSKSYLDGLASGRWRVCSRGKAEGIARALQVPLETLFCPIPSTSRRRAHQKPEEVAGCSGS